MLVAQTDQLGGLTGWIADVLSSLGALGVGLLTLLEVFVPPIPSEVVLPLAGYLVSEGRLGPVAVVGGATIGSLVGALGFYAIGAGLGRERLDRGLHKVPLVSEEDLDRSWSWFDEHGGSAVLVGRMIPGVRSVISIPAGSSHMSLWRFTIYTTLGSLAWNAALIGVGWLLGSQWRDVERYSTWLDVALVAIVVVAVARFVWARRDRIGGGSDDTDREEADRGGADEPTADAARSEERDE